MYKLFLSTRYLLRVLVLVAILVLSLAIAVLVVAPSIMSGFQEEFHKRLRETLSDLSIWTAQPFGLSDDPEIEAYLESLPNVVAAAPYIDNPALDKHLDKIDYCMLRGVIPSKEAEVSELRKYFVSPREAYKELEDFDRRSDADQALIKEVADTLPGTVDPDVVFRQLVEGAPEAADQPAIAVGVYYLRRWKLMIGDTVKLTTASEQGEVAQDKRFKIVGAFRTGHHDTDRRLVIMSLQNAQEFIKVPGKVSGYSLRLSDHELAQQTKDALREDIRNPASRIPLPRDEGYFVNTWEERNQNLLRAVAMEKLLIRMITGLIVIAAAASIFLVLFMSVHTKVRELGILRAIGATRGGVFSMFLVQGVLIAMCAMVLGLLLGIVCASYINEMADAIYTYTGWHPFPPDVYYLEEIPVKIDIRENGMNFVATLLLGGLAALVPGLLAALKPPLKAIRYD